MTSGAFVFTDCAHCLLTAISISAQWSTNIRGDDGTKFVTQYTTNRCKWNALFFHIVQYYISGYHSVARVYPAVRQSSLERVSDMSFVFLSKLKWISWCIVFWIFYLGFFGFGILYGTVYCLLCKISFVFYFTFSYLGLIFFPVMKPTAFVMNFCMTFINLNCFLFCNHFNCVCYC